MIGVMDPGQMKKRRKRMRDKSKLAMKRVKIVNGDLKGNEIFIEDWWEIVYGSSWMSADGNPACMNYAMRTGLQKFKVPIDDEVLYGKIGGLSHLVHISELEKGEEDDKGRETI